MTTHREALEAVITSGQDRLTAADAAIIHLARTLADQCDAAGDKGPGTRLVATYLTALRTLAPAVGRQPLERATKLADLQQRAGVRGLRAAK